jgi:hypothetical protein
MLLNTDAYTPLPCFTSPWPSHMCNFPLLLLNTIVWVKILFCLSGTCKLLKLINKLTPKGVTFITSTQMLHRTRNNKQTQLLHVSPEALRESPSNIFLSIQGSPGIIQHFQVSECHAVVACQCCPVSQNAVNTTLTLCCGCLTHPSLNTDLGPSNVELLGSAEWPQRKTLLTGRWDESEVYQQM